MLAHPRIDAVGADQKVRFFHTAVGELDHDLVGLFVEAGHLAVENDGVESERSSQRAIEFGPR
jgi:hypothetical protein